MQAAFETALARVVPSLGYIIIGWVVIVLLTLALGPAIIAARDWFRKGGHW